MSSVFRFIVWILFLICFAGCDETILHGLDENKANRVSVILERVGIESHKQQSGTTWNVKVASNELVPALQVLDASRVLTKGENRFNIQEASLLPDDNQQLQFAERQLAWSIEETLERVPGVIEAKVHLWLNRPTQLGLKTQENSARSAAALLLVESGTDLNTDEIKTLLRGATGVPMDAVNIVTRVIPQRTATETLTDGNISAVTVWNPHWRWVLSLAAIIFCAILYRRLRAKKQPKLSPSLIRRSDATV